MDIDQEKIESDEMEVAVPKNWIICEILHLLYYTPLMCWHHPLACV